MIEIEKNVPMLEEPPRSKRKYPLPDMEIGDSFLVKGIEREASFRATMLTASKRLNIQVSVRKVEGGLRVWRIA